MPHSIRLRGPWEYQPLIRFVPLASGQMQATTDDLPPGGRIHLPADWGEALGRNFQGTVRFTRRFNRPTGLDRGSRVWLVIDDIDWQAAAALNDRLCGEVISSGASEVSDAQRCPARFDITAELLPQNLLSIAVSSPMLSADGFPLPRPGREGMPGGLFGVVRLDIE
jgi:hypothetical protein